ncbi:MAG: hypothetical protein ACYDA2_08990 [Acidimicrobiales bacterium]
MRTRKRLTVATAGIGVAALAVLAWAGAAAAISAGPTPPAAQGCPAFDNASTFTGTYPGCHNLQLTITDGNGGQYAEAGLNQVGQGDNYHSGTVMVTPWGDGNPYGTKSGQPYGSDPSSCPTSAQYASPDPGQTETDNTGGGCPQPPYAAPTHPAAGAGFDTNYQPFPTYECGVEDIALYGAEWVLYVAGQSNHQCPFAPVGWDGPFTPLTDNQSEASQPFDPTTFAAFSPDWVTSLHPEWTLPGTAPTLSPWAQPGTVDTSWTNIVTDGGQVYLAGDDNGDSGEHDGTDGQYASGNTFYGSSDGGAFILTWAPLQGASSGASIVQSWTALFEAAAGSQSAAPLAPVMENPFPFLTFGGGACADQICAGAYTSQRTLYSGGGGSGSQRDVYNYQEPNGSSKDWGPYNCSSGSKANEQACTTQPGSDGTTRNCSPTETNNANDPTCGMNYYKQQEASNVTTEPGVMVYADPDPEASPVAPFDPIPSAYVGTCGVVLGGGVAAPSSASGLPFTLPSAPFVTGPSPAPPPQLAPVASTNSAGQLILADPTGC